MEVDYRRRCHLVRVILVLRLEKRAEERRNQANLGPSLPPLLPPFLPQSWCPLDVAVEETKVAAGRRGGGRLADRPTPQVPSFTTPLQTLHCQLLRLSFLSAMLSRSVFPSISGSK